MPGLLQTEKYIQTILNRSSQLTPEEVDEQVEARLKRQQILTRTRPPEYYVVLDDHVLRRPIGGSKVMHDQSMRLVELADLPNVRLQGHVIERAAAVQPLRET